ncbi:MAG TPA: TatD family hydrolase [Anaeromyxobacteraceae bacterium]|nr:TatD family hydrolase [Anaeromyxobacteraceae bacterium]
MLLVDSHAHLDPGDGRPDLEGVVERARRAGVVRVVLIGLWRGPGDFGNALELARARPELFLATVGIHPHECARVPEEDWERCRRTAGDPLVVGVGETGLDYHYDLSPREEQRASFRRSLAIARAAGKPVVVHVREADPDCARILREEGVPEAGGVIHCFTGDVVAARAYLDLGLYLSVAGVVTFRSAEPIREAVRIVPRNRLLLETDSPYLAPVPHRGRPNEPAHVRLVAEKVAELWGVPAEEVARVTGENAARLFRFPPPA